MACAVAVFGGGALLSGAEPESPAPQPDESERRPIVIPADTPLGTANDLLLKKFDLNRDGKIDDAEIAAAQAKAGTNRPPSFTTVEDGRRLNLKDLYEGGDPTQRRAKSPVTSDDFLRQYDRNGDGQLDATEFNLLKQALETGGRKPELRPAVAPPPPAKPMPILKQPIR